MLAWAKNTLRAYRNGALRRRPLRSFCRRRPWWRIRPLPSLFELAIAFIVISTAITANWLGVFSRVKVDMVETTTAFDRFGTATASVGDTLAFNGGALHLIGVDAPSDGVTCHDRKSGQKVACGIIAGETLNALVRGREVRCSAPIRTARGQNQATCSVVVSGERIDLGHYIVAHGWAVANRLDDPRYALDEIAARIHQSGLWATDYVPPEPSARTETVASR